MLFDDFPDGGQVLGGAPLNVAWHLRGFGASPLLISRLGTDELGERARGALAAWDLDREGLQRDPQHPTGRVTVSLRRDGSPTFDIADGQAYDFVDAGAAVGLLAGVRPALVYHGTLAARAPTSAGALDAVVSAAAAPVFLDLNLRAPWWQRATVHRLLDRATWCKLSQEELVALSSAAEGRTAEVAELAAALRQRHQLTLVAVTRGAAGALAVTPTSIARATATPVGRVVDTLGAGDGFTAVLILGTLAGWPLDTLLARAGAFAAAICEVRGAVPRQRAFYRRFLEAWGEPS